MRRLLKISSITLVILFIFSQILIQKQFKPDNYQQFENFKKPVNVKSDNQIWQVLETTVGPVNLLNAYFDERFGQKSIKISGVGHRNLTKQRDKFFCQFWFDNIDKNPKIVKVTQFANLFVHRNVTNGVQSRFVS